MKLLLLSVAILSGCANLESAGLADIVNYSRMACASGDVDKCRSTAIFLMNGGAATREEAVEEYNTACARLVRIKHAEPRVCAETAAELTRRPVGQPAIKRF